MLPAASLPACSQEAVRRLRWFTKCDCSTGHLVKMFGWLGLKPIKPKQQAKRGKRGQVAKKGQKAQRRK